MSLEAFVNSKFGHSVASVLGSAMESRFRYRFFGPMMTLQGADIQPGQTVLEVGCGTGFFTVPVAQLIGEMGNLVAMDVIPEAIELVSRKVQAASLKNVRVVKGNAMNTELGDESFDAVLLFGVIPAPMLPLNRLLPEMHRILKPEGILAVWPPVPCWLPQSIIRTGLFEFVRERKGVNNFRRGSHSC